MTNDELNLRDVAQAASDRHGGARGRQLDRVAKAKGLTLSYTTVDKILNGTYTSRPGNDTLDALAVLSGISKAKVYEAAKRPLPLAPLADRMPADADSLTPEQQNAVLDIVRQFASLNQRLARASEENDRGNTASTNPGVEPATPLSERRRRQSHEAVTSVTPASRRTAARKSSSAVTDRNAKV